MVVEFAEPLSARRGSHLRRQVANENHLSEGSEKLIVGASVKCDDFIWINMRLVKLKFILLPALFLSACCNAELIYADAPKEDQEIVYNYVRKILQPDTAISNNLHRADFRIAAPFREYFVEPGDVAAGRLLSATKSGAWQFLVFRGTNVIGIAYCMFDSKSGKPVPCVEFGTVAYPMEPVIMAEQLPQIKQQDYEVRLFGASFFRGLWLHAKSNDIFISADNGFGKLQAFRRYSEAQLIKILQPYEQTMMPINMESSRQFERNLSMYGEAMMNYEKVHGGKQSPISPVLLVLQENLSAVVQILSLQGISSEGQKLNYKIKVTYADKTHFVVSRVDILEKNQLVNFLK